jgi:hypothetical protein
MSEKLAVEIRDALLNQKALIKQASFQRDEALQKAAQFEEEIRVLRDVLDLVSKGVIDPTDAVSKAAEFLNDPQQLEVLKQAHMLGFSEVPRIGIPQTEEKPKGEKAEEALVQLFQDLENRSPNNQ